MTGRSYFRTIMTARRRLRSAGRDGRGATGFPNLAFFGPQGEVRFVELGAEGGGLNETQPR